MNKRVMLILMFMISLASYSLEIYRTDRLDFGNVVRGDRRVVVDNIKVYVDGEAGKDVRIRVPEGKRTRVGILNMRAKNEVIKLDSRGRGRFILRCELKPTFSGYGKIDDKININVEYN